MDGGENLLDSFVLHSFFDSLLVESDVNLLFSVVSGTLSIAFLFELVDDFFVLPANSLSEITEDGVFTARTETSDTESIRADNTFNFLVSRRDTFEALRKSMRNKKGFHTRSLLRASSPLATFLRIIPLMAFLSIIEGDLL